jgi:Na+-driven multidrug efflux pump
VVLLWSSRVWSDRDKLLGTLIVPGGLLLPAYLLVAAIEPADSNNPSALVWLGMIAGAVGPCVMVLYLARKLSRARQS